MKTLLIIPAYNEEDCLPHLLDEVCQSGAYDAVVVNDASSDLTESLAKRSGLPVLSLSVNLGIGGGVQTGFIYALRNDYDLVVQVDGDGQHDPKEIWKITNPIIEGKADCVIGSRYMPQVRDAKYRTPITRRMGMYFSTTILRLATGLRIYDTTSGFRALNRTAFTFFASRYPVDHPEAEALLLLHREGFRILEVPVEMRNRKSGQSLFTFFRSLLYPLRVTIGFMGILYKTRR